MICISEEEKQKIESGKNRYLNDGVAGYAGFESVVY